MAGTSDTKELFTASEVARFCQVDLKTIHNWADRGEIRHFRTPGRHLRFRRVDVLDFLRRYGYPIPELLLQGKPRVHVIDEDPASLASVSVGLADSFELTTFGEPVDALIAIGADAPDVVVLDANGDRLDGMQCIARLKALSSTRHARIVVFSADPSVREPALNAGASAFVGKPDVQQLRETLRGLMGIHA
jgi:excisionase family DNA binding protein